MGKAARLNRERINRNIEKIAKDIPWLSTLPHSAQIKIQSNILAHSALYNLTLVGVMYDPQIDKCLTCQGTEAEEELESFAQKGFLTGIVQTSNLEASHIARETRRLGLSRIVPKN